MSNPSDKGRSHGDQAALIPVSPEFDAFVVSNEQKLYLYLRRLLSSDESARDLVQEAFFRAWTHFETIRTYDKPEAWLYRIATNLALSALRRREPHSLTQLHEYDEGHTYGDRDPQALLTDPEDMEERAVERDVIDRALCALPERQRIALLLRGLHGLSVEEIAQVLEVSIANVYQLLSRGAKQFRMLYLVAQHEDSTHE